MKTIDMTNNDFTDYQSDIIRCSECKETTRFLVKNKDIDEWLGKGILPDKVEAIGKLEEEDYALFIWGRHESCEYKEEENGI
jgi:hypothetical protein